MDIKLTATVSFEIAIPDTDNTKASRVYQLCVPSWATYDECKEVCSAFIAGFDDMREKNKAQQEKLTFEIAIPDTDNTKASRVYQLCVPSWATYDECKEVCSAFIAGFDDMREKNKAQQEKLKAESASAEATAGQAAPGGE